MSKQFVEISEAQISENSNLKCAKQTDYGTKSARVLFDKYLAYKGIASIKSVTPAELSGLLEHFYLSVRKTDGEDYKKGSFLTLRHNLNRSFKADLGTDFDIINNPSFEKANTIFLNKLKQLKQDGKASTKHFDTIVNDDLKKINQMSHDSPVKLQLKVWFNLQFYFCRRGAENLTSKKISDFEIVEEGDRRYVRQVTDEMTKNHRESHTEDTIQGKMWDSEGPNDPVTLFEWYLSKLNTNNLKLWQQSKASFIEEEKEWYTTRHVGHNGIAQFMKQISKHASLSRTYTNHCIRVTTCSQLGNMGFQDSEIKTVSGHASVSALSIYKHTMRNGNKKCRMHYLKVPAVLDKL